MKSHLLRTLTLLFVLVLVSGCELVGDIFKAGVGVGVFLVILVVAVIIWAIAKFRD